MKLARWNRLVLIGYAVVLAIATFAMYEYWSFRYAAVLRLSSESLQSIALSIDATAKSAQDHVAILQEEAERALAAPPDAPNPLRLALRPSTSQTFALERLPPDSAPSHSSYITGHGNPALFPGALQGEIDAVLNLSPLLHRIRTNVPEAVWVYYTSTNRFVVIHPYEGQADHVRWNDDMLAHPIVTDSAPAKNPSGKHLWSPAYVDEAGKGLMSSRVAPVRGPDGDFRGIVGLDITLGTLRGFLVGPGLADGAVLLINNHGQVLAGNPLELPAAHAVPALSEALPPALRGAVPLDAGDLGTPYAAREGWLLRTTKLEHAPWTLLHLIDQRQLQMQVLGQLRGGLAALLLVLLSIVLFEQRRKNLQHLKTFRAAVDASASAIIITDPSSVIEYANPSFSKITGFTTAEIEGQTPAILKSGKTPNAVYRDLWTTLAHHKAWQGEILDRRKDGEEYWADLRIAPVRGTGGQIEHYIGIIHDISARKANEEAIRRQANFDALTGLANRSLLQDRLAHALAHARRTHTKIGVIFIDLDGFKWINDTMGHDVGDKLLVEVAQRLGSCVREQDTVARLGGDEFTIVVQDILSAADLNAIAEKIVLVLRNPFSLESIEHRMSASVGVTVYPDDGEDVKTLFRNADIAMYKSKQAGKNRYQFYAQDMQTDALARMRIEAELRVALERKDFVLHYQPIVDADSGELVGAEALIRWVHPDRGLISPLDFIPIAEDCGLICGIGEWALREAARQASQWQDRGHGLLRLSVNMSGVQFREASLPDVIEKALRDYAIDRGRLYLELTESVLMGGSESMEARMAAIKALGIRYALDDFGTGFSSLSYLKRFPVDLVKIDRSFIRDCPDDRNDAHLVEAIINMAHSLELRVTAEGVETEAQINFLRDLGCDYLQGHAISPPIPADQFAALIERHFLLPAVDAATPEETRLLTALRHDDLDVDDWLRRLLGERSAELAAYVERNHWSLHGLDLREAVKTHLDWRKALNDYIAGRPAARTFDIAHASAVDCCQLGHWIQHAADDFNPGISAVDRAHREFHRLAGQIVADYNQGYQASARRTLAGLKFRTSSRDVVIALIDCFVLNAADARPPAAQNP